MAQLLFKLKEVPLDEAEEVRALLEEADVDFYETDAGTWGLGVAAIWLPDDHQLSHAQDLLEAYQERLAIAMADAPTEPWLNFLQRKPLKVISLSILLCAVLYLLLAPFIGMMLPD